MVIRARQDMAADPARAPRERVAQRAGDGRVQDDITVLFHTRWSARIEARGNVGQPGVVIGVPVIRTEADELVGRWWFTPVMRVRAVGMELAHMGRADRR